MFQVSENIILRKLTMCREWGGAVSGRGSSDCLKAPRTLEAEFFQDERGITFFNFFDIVNLITNERKHILLFLFNQHAHIVC